MFGIAVEPFLGLRITPEKAYTNITFLFLTAITFKMPIITPEETIQRVDKIIDANIDWTKDFFYARHQIKAKHEELKVKIEICVYIIARFVLEPKEHYTKRNAKNL